MASFIVEGGRRLEGRINVHGSKNAVLPILAATVLNKGKNRIRNCPKLKDVASSIEILRFLGCTAEWNGDILEINSKDMTNDYIPEYLMSGMRSSITYLGAIAGRFKKATICCLPGGCTLGPRPIDLHIKALKDLGFEISDTAGCIKCTAGHVVPAPIHLNQASVGATENVMLALAVSGGTTVIGNAAREPEIVDLANFLNAAGAQISGAGTSQITINGVRELMDVDYTVMNDRIVAVTYLAGAMITGGKLEVAGIKPEYINAELSVFKDCGAKITMGGDSVLLEAPGEINHITYLQTQPYPGFPTDSQSLVSAMLTTAKGTSIISEHIFESRFRALEDMARMGADVLIKDRNAIITGVPKLTGAVVSAADLRGGAALLIAGLAAEGRTEITEISHIARGYADIAESFNSVGAKITVK